MINCAVINLQQTCWLLDAFVCIALLIDYRLYIR